MLCPPRSTRSLTRDIASSTLGRNRHSFRLLRGQPGRDQIGIYKIRTMRVVRQKLPRKCSLARPIRASNDVDVSAHHASRRCMNRVLRLHIRQQISMCSLYRPILPQPPPLRLRQRFMAQSIFPHQPRPLLYPVRLHSARAAAPPPEFAAPRRANVQTPDTQSDLPNLAAARSSTLHIVTTTLL